MSQADDRRARLGDLLDKRFEELGRMELARTGRDLRWQDVADAAGLSEETLRVVRRGTGSIRPRTRDRIERGLQLRAGAIQDFLTGAADGLAAADPPPGGHATPDGHTPGGGDAYADAIMAIPGLTDEERRGAIAWIRVLRARTDQQRNGGPVTSSTA
jgi:hypothetical protein